MATVISKDQYIKYDGKARTKFDNIFVEYQSKSGGTRERVRMSELYTEDSSSKPKRKIKSYSEFVKKLSKNLVFTGESGAQRVNEFSQDVFPQVVGVEVPNRHTTIELNPQDEKIPYGLNRSLKVAEADSKVPDADQYLYVEINGKGVFLKPTEIYFYDKSGKKRLFSEIKNIQITEKPYYKSMVKRGNYQVDHMKSWATGRTTGTFDTYKSSKIIRSYEIKITLENEEYVFLTFDQPTIFQLQNKKNN